MRSARFLTFSLIPLVALCSPPPNENVVHVLFGLYSPQSGIFPSDAFTAADEAQKTGFRVDLPLPDCSVRPSDCADLRLINVLDGFSLQPRVTVPFDGDINPSSVSSTTVFFLELGNADLDDRDRDRRDGRLRTIGVNQLVWDPTSHVLVAQPDEQLKQHTTYAFVVTTGVLDAEGSPVGASEALERLRHNVRFHSEYRRAILNAYAALRRLGIPAHQVAGLSVFTTQSPTAVLERIRDEIKASAPEPATFLLGPGNTRTVFSLGSIQSIDWQQQIKVNPPAFQSFKPQYAGETNPLLLPDLYQPGAVGRIAYGSFKSPRYISDEPVMPPIGTRSAIPPVQQMETLYFNVFLPSGTPPPGGWPVVIFGLGGGDYKEEMPWFFVAAFASRGMATVCINVVGQAYGPLSFLKITLKDGSVIQFPSGGRGRDINGDGAIDNNEGVSTIRPAQLSVGARDTIRQQVVDFMQLVRVIQIGVDVDGDGRVDFDPSQISYFGISFGAGAFGPAFMAIEPDVQVGALASPGGLNSRFDLLRMRPAARSQVGQALAARVPSLLNSPGLTSFAGVPVAAPFFNENIPLRDLPIVTDHVDGAMDIQQYFDRLAWIAGSGDGASYTPHIRKEPLGSVLPKSILINFGRGDQTAPNPRTTQLLRAGDLADITTLYRNDLAYAEDSTVVKNPHTYTMRWMLPGLSGPIGRSALDQIAAFLASRGQTILHPEPARFFEVPILLPLPEDFAYIQ